MCGIVGLIRWSRTQRPEGYRLHEALAALRHRGPDDARVVSLGAAHFGTARLAMVDRPTSIQPRADAAGQRLLAFNGEIYNYRELRRDLVEAGYPFETDGDTEVVVAALASWGVNALARFKGQFALALWNDITGELLLARDRFGIVPLFWQSTPDGVAFASEVKALHALGLRQALSVVDLVDVGVLWGTHPGRSVFADVESVRPGGYVVAGADGVRRETYWTLNFPESRDQSSLADQAEFLRDVLSQAVARRLPAYGDPAVLMSGGLDSTAVAALLRDLRPDARLASYSIGFTRAALDEQRFQHLAAESYRTDHHAIICDDDLVAGTLVEAIWHSEQPLTRTACASSIALAAAIERDGSRSVLSGEGADELLCGYDLFKLAEVRAQWSVQGGNPPDGLANVTAHEARLGRAVSSAFFEQGIEHRDDPLFSHLPRWAGAHRITQYLAPPHRDAVTLDAVLGRVRERLPAAFHGWSVVEKAQFLEVAYFLPSSLLASQCDRPLMAHSIEGRYPFLDEDVVDFALSLPQRSKLDGTTEKAVLKQAMAEAVPGVIRDRPKQPYTAPEGDVFRSPQGQQLLAETVGPAALRAHGVFDEKRVAWLVDKVQHGKTSFHDDLALLWIVSVQVLAQTYPVAG